MKKDNRYKKAIIIFFVIIALTIWWRVPLFYGDWNKQTIYVGIIDTWNGNSNDSRAHAMWIDDDCGEGIHKVNHISNEIGIKPVYAIIPEKTTTHLVDSLIHWQNHGAGIVLHGLRHERWDDWDERRITKDIEQSYEKLHELGFDTTKILKIIVPPHACNTQELGRIGITPDIDTTKMRVLLEKAYQRNNFVIFGTHSSLPGAFSEEKTIKVLKMAKEIGFDFDFNH